MMMRMVGMARATIQVEVAAMARVTILVAAMAKVTIHMVVTARATIVSLKSPLMTGGQHKKQTWSPTKKDCLEDLTMMTRTWRVMHKRQTSSNMKKDYSEKLKMMKT